MSKDIFKNHPNLSEAFETSDGNFFYSKNAAENHAKTLKDKTVKVYTNPSEKVAVVEEPAFVQVGEQEDGAPKIEAKLSPKKQQAQTDYEAKFGEIPAEEITTKQLLEAIEKGEKIVAEPQND